MVDADGTNLRRIVPGSIFLSLFDPTWSPVPAPDGQYKIAFCGDSDGAHGQIWICNPDGSELVNISGDVTRSDYSPAWSPTGRAIATGTSTTSALPRGVRVYTIAAAGDRVVQAGAWDATAGTGLDGAQMSMLDWSPVAQRLVMSVSDDANGGRELWCLDLDSGAAWPITATASAGEKDPAWSPDGTRIVYRYEGSRSEAKYTGLPWRATSIDLLPPPARLLGTYSHASCSLDSRALSRESRSSKSGCGPMNMISISA